MNLDPTVLEALESIRWFQSCGLDSELSVERHMRQVSSWAEADEAYDEAWESIIHQQQNLITRTLSSQYNAKYQLWNKLILSAKPEVLRRIGPALGEAVGFAGLKDFYFSAITSDVELYLMELTYAQHGCAIPIFFRNLFAVYSAGHFPCGWTGGKFPEGNLLYY